MSTTQKIAEFTADLSLEDVPARAIYIARGGLLDALGPAIAGTQSEAARIITGWTRAQGGVESSGVMGGGFRTSPAMAARANGTIGHAFDFDPPLPLLPVLLALGESTGASGRAVLEAYIAAFEVQSKLQGGVSARHTAMGWHSNTVFGTLGATVAAARLLKLDIAQMRMALGIAASATGGLLQNLGTMTKPLHAGMAASNGILAASLAAEGFGAAPDALEGRFGVLPVFINQGEYDEQHIADTFGAPWDLIDKEIRIKPFPCCRWAHRPIDALLAMVAEHDLKSEDIEAIECVVGSPVTQVMNSNTPCNGLEAKFSLPYCLAVTVIDRNAGLEQFTDVRVADARVHAFARKVKVVQFDEDGRPDSGPLAPCTVRLHLADGRHLERIPDAARGDRENPMNFDAIADKYRGCARGLLNPEDADRILQIVRQLETMPDLSDLYTILTFGVRPPGRATA